MSSFRVSQLYKERDFSIYLVHSLESKTDCMSNRKMDTYRVQGYEGRHMDFPHYSYLLSFIFHVYKSKPLLLFMVYWDCVKLKPKKDQMSQMFYSLVLELHCKVSLDKMMKWKQDKHFFLNTLVIISELDHNPAPTHLVVSSSCPLFRLKRPLCFLVLSAYSGNRYWCACICRTCVSDVWD